MPHVFALAPKCDGKTDDTVAIQAEINARNATLPYGDCIITHTLYIGNGTDTKPSSQNSLFLRGQGMYGTILVWGGPNNGTMISVRGPVLDVTISGINLYGNNKAGYGVWTTQMGLSKFDQVKVTGFTNTAFVFTVNETSHNTDWGGGCANILNQISSGNPANAQANGILLDGSIKTGLDSCRNQFNEMEINYGGGIRSCGITLAFTDNNVFNTGMIYPTSRGDGHGVCLNQQISRSFPQENVFIEVAVLQGVSGTSGTGGNWFMPYPTSDGETVPNIANVHYMLYNGVIS